MQFRKLAQSAKFAELGPNFTQFAKLTINYYYICTVNDLKIKPFFWFLFRSIKMRKIYIFVHEFDFLSFSNAKSVTKSFHWNGSNDISK